MRGIPARRLAELRSKLDSLRAEMDGWLHLTETQNNLKRHHSQIRLLDATLSSLVAPVRDAVQASGAEAIVLDKGAEWESHLLAAHSIWEVFRSKYVLRQNDTFRDYLAACDDLAWACYSPALECFAVKGSKEPALVFLSATWSPFAHSRDTNFLNEVRRTADSLDAFRADGFDKVLRKLPISLISLPWYQAFHVPGAVIIAHEVGHLVEADFGLHGELVAALDRTSLSFGDSWTAWASEVFADVYGCLAMGPAFPGVLIDLLAMSIERVTTERALGGSHPPRALRVELLLEVLRRSGYVAEATRLEGTWRSVYPAKHAMSDVAGDCAKVAEAVMSGPYRGKKLTDVISLPMGPRLEFLRTFAGQGNANQLRKYGDVDSRYLFIAAQMLHENPESRQSPRAFKLLVQQALRRGENQFRSRGEPIASLADLDKQLESREKQAVEIGEELRSLVSSLSTAAPSPADAPPDLRTP